MNDGNHRDQEGPPAARNSERPSLLDAPPEDEPTRVGSLEDIEALLREELDALEGPGDRPDASGPAVREPSREPTSSAPVEAPRSAPPVSPLPPVHLDLDDLLEDIDLETRVASIDPQTGEVRDESSGRAASPAGETPFEASNTSTDPGDENVGLADNDVEAAFFEEPRRSIAEPPTGALAELEAELAAAGFAVSGGQAGAPAPEAATSSFDPFAEPGPAPEAPDLDPRSDAGERDDQDATPLESSGDEDVEIDIGSDEEDEDVLLSVGDDEVGDEDEEVLLSVGDDEVGDEDEEVLLDVGGDQPPAPRAEPQPDTTAPETSEPSLSDDSVQPSPSASSPERDEGALAALRTLRRRKPRSDHFEFVGDDPETLRARRDLLRELAAATQGTARAHALVAAAELSERLGEPDEALADHQDALAEQPDHPVALRSAQRLLLTRQAWSEAVELLERELTLRQDPGERRALLAQLVEVRDRALGEPEAALELLRRDLEQVSEASVAQPGLALLGARLALRLGRRAEAAELLARTAERWSDGLARGALRQAAALLLAEEGHPEGALRLLSETPPETLSGWALGLAVQSSWLSGSEQQARTWLEQLAERVPAWRPALSTVEAQRNLALEPDRAGTPPAPEEPTAAFRAASTLLHWRAANGERSGWEALLHASTQWAGQADGAERVVALGLRASAAMELGERAEAEQALLEAQQAGHLGALVGWWRERLGLPAPDRADEPYAEAARTVVEGGGGSPAEVEALQAAASGAHPEAADVLLVDAARQAPEVALEALQRAANRRSGLDRLQALVALAARLGPAPPADLAEMIARGLAADAPGEPWATRLGWHRLKGASDLPDEARARLGIDAWLDEATATAGTLGATAGLQAAGLAVALGDEEAALEALRRAMEAAPEYPPVHWHLQELARRLGLTDVQLESLQMAAESAASPFEAALEASRAAWIRAADDAAGARQDLEVAIERHGTDASAHQLALALAESAGDAPVEVARALLEAADAVQAPSLQRRWRLEAGLRALAADEPQLALEALQALRAEAQHDLFENLLDEAERRAGRFARLAEQRVAAVRSAPEALQAAALEALVDFDLWDRDDPASAVLSAQQLLELEPQHRLALRLLERHLMVGDRRAELARVQALLAELHEARPLVDAHRRLAVHALRCSEEGLEAADELLLGWTGAQPPLDGWTALRLEGAARDREDLEALEVAHRVQLDASTDPLARATAAARLAEVAELRGHPEAALEPLAEACAQAPEHGVAQERLARLAAAVGRHELAAEAFERAAGASSLPRRAAALEYRAGRLWAERVGRPERAIEAFRRAAEHDIGYLDVFDRLRGLLEERGEDEALLQLVGRRIAAGGNAEQLARLYLLQADVARRLGRTDLEEEALRSTLALEPERREALDRLADLAFEAGKWREAAETLVRAARLTRDRERLRDVFMRLGEIYQRHLPDPRRAEAAYRRALKLSPDDLDAMRALAEVLRSEGRHQEAIDTLRRLATSEADPDTQREVRLRLAEVLEEQGALREAEAELERARKQSPTDMALLEALTRFYERHGAGPALGVHLGRALSDFRHAVERDPTDLAAWHGLCEVLHWRRQPQAARLCARVAVGLGLEHERLRELAGQGPLPGIGRAVGTDEVDEALAPPPLSLGTREAFHLAREAFDKVLPFDRSAVGARSVDRGEPIVRRAAEVAEWLGLGRLELYVTDVRPWIAVPTGAEPAGVLLGSAWLGRPEAEQRFVLARAANAAREGLAVLFRLAPQEALRAVAALVLHHHPEAVPEALHTAEMSDLGKRLSKAMKRRARSELDPLMVELAGAVFAPRGALLHAAAAFANRVALLAGGEADAALEALCRLHHGEAFPDRSTPGSRIGLVHKHPECWDLLRFAIEDVHLGLRDKLGASAR